MDGISVIVPTLNRTNFIINTLQALMVQQFRRPYEVIVVDQSEQPDQHVKDFAATYVGQIIYCHITTFRGLPEARNFGWQHARFDYLLYLDDDIEIDSNLLEEHYKYIIKPEIGVVAGGITERYKKNPHVLKIGEYNFYTASPIRGFNMNKKCYVDHAPGGNFSIKKELIERCGGSDEYLNVGAALYEESDLCLRIKETGSVIFFNYDAHIFHLAANTGGCRVSDINKYIYSLVHNRSLIIARHLNSLQRMTATVYLIKLVLSYSLSYKKCLFGTFFQAYKRGAIHGKSTPKCTIYI